MEKIIIILWKNLTKNINSVKRVGILTITEKMHASEKAETHFYGDSKIYYFTMALFKISDFKATVRDTYT